MHKIIIQKLKGFLQSLYDKYEILDSQPLFLTILELNILVRIRDYLQSYTENDQSEDRQSLDILLEYHLAKRTTKILSRFSPNMTLNYYPDNSPYPDDIDDTFSALHAIYKYDSNLITPIHIANIISNLEKIRIKDKPYIFNTWYKSISDDQNPWLSIDPIAMSAIPAFLENFNINSLQLNDYIYESIIDFKSFDHTEPTSEFYHSFPLAIYLCTRISLNKIKAENLISIARRHLNLYTTSLTDPEKAFIESSINFLNRSHKNSFEFDQINSASIIDRISEQITDTPLYVESIKNDKYCFRTSDTISRLISFESIFGSNIFQSQILINDIHDLDGKISKYITEFIDQKINLNLLTDDSSKKFHTDIITSKDNQIVIDLLKIKSEIESCDLVLLQPYLNTHLLGLFAYNLYDKIIDKEIEIEALPYFAKLHREFINQLSTFDIVPHTFYLDILESTDYFYKNTGNNYKEHSYKSAGISIVPILLFPQYQADLSRFFKHYQLARQLADDLKDFHHDLKINKITTMQSFLDKDSASHESIDKILNIDRVFIAIYEELDEAKLSIKQIDTEIQTTLLRYIEDLKTKIDSCKFELEIISKLKLFQDQSTLLLQAKSI